MRRSVDQLLHVRLHVSAGVAQTDGPADSEKHKETDLSSPSLLTLRRFFLSLSSSSLSDLTLPISPEYLTVGRGAADAEALNDTFQLKVLRRLRGELAVASHGTRLVAVVQLLRTRCSP
jgi:hypothetical protein